MRAGRGGKVLASRLQAGAPLAKVLYEDRPYLRPIKFVRSVLTATLFTKEEELIQPIQESSSMSFCRVLIFVAQGSS